MKCDNCLHAKNVQPTLDSPYGEEYCAKGHWEGSEPIIEDALRIGPDIWANCSDFQSKPPACFACAYPNNGYVHTCGKYKRV